MIWQVEAGMKRGIVLTTLLLTACSSSYLVSIPLRSLDIQALTNESDLIVVGRVTTVVPEKTTLIDSSGGSVRATQFRASLKRDRTFKGNIPGSPVIFSFLLPEKPIGFQGVTAGQYGIFFFKKVADHWEFFDPEHPCLPALPGLRSISGTALDQITIFLGQVLLSPHATPSDNFRSLDALSRLQTDLSQKILRQAFENSSGNLRLMIAGALVAHNDVTGLEAITIALLHPAGLPESLLRNLTGSLSGLKSPKAIPDLVRLIKTKNEEIHRFSAVALRQTASPMALAPLSQLLEDSDLLTRYYAVAGLGEITGQNDWTPAFDEFQKNQKRYLSYWQTWAELNLPAALSVR
jgi:hypothetical protein